MLASDGARRILPASEERSDTEVKPTSNTRNTLRKLRIWPNGHVTGPMHRDHSESEAERKERVEHEIRQAHPLVSGDHARYARAEELVHDRHDKYELVDLVNWLLARAESAEAKAQEE